MGKPEMVERVAAALLHNGDPKTKAAAPWAATPEREREFWRCHARAAITAMREPTTEMEIAGTEQWLCEAAMEDRSGANWKAMIDEALRSP